jgi:pimeloyl-ACP methyl ester carboxylesterase
MRILRRWWWLLPLLAILALGGFVIWASTPAGPMPEAWLAWFFYPGGHVDPRSYAPAAHALAKERYLVVIVPMPLNLAVSAPDRAAEVMAALPDIGGWAVGGHSLGGAMAARFAYQNPEAVQALMLWADYPASTDDLSGRPLAVTSIYAANGGLATEDKIAASRPLLPGTTRWVAIEGGNHAQFGWYGPQSGDGTATISREEQQRQIVAATLKLLSSLAAPGS